MGGDEDFGERLVRIETKVDMLIESQRENNKTANLQREKLEERVEEIERRLNIFIGAILVCNFLLVFFAPQIRAIFEK